MRMIKKEAVTRVKTGNFNNGLGFDMQLLVDAVGTLGEMFKSGEISEMASEDKPGHWIVLENCSNAGVYCSECHTKIFDHYPMKKKFSYFCPHCGTRMEGQVVKW